jgi:hypothetical protein
MKLHGAVLFPLCVAVLGAQSTVFEQAPPGVEDVLRDRVQKFYQCFVDRRYRDAEQLVAEDSQELYFEMQKPHYNDFRIGKINFEADYLKASVVILVKAQFRFDNRSFPETVPLTSYWKVENGAWEWYVPKIVEQDTPFGKIHIDPRAHTPDAPSGNGAPDFSGVVQKLRTIVTVEPRQIRLKAGSDNSADVLVKNNGDAAVIVNITGTLPGGLTIDPNPAKLAGNQSVKLHIRWNPPAKSAGAYTPPTAATIGLLIAPVGEKIPLPVAFE